MKAKKVKAKTYPIASRRIGFTLLASGVIPVSKSTGRILLAKRSGSVDMTGYWCLFGGKKNDGESYVNAALRELKEETGYIGTISMSKPFITRTGALTYYNFFGLVNNEFTPFLNYEHDDCGWFSIDNPPSKLHPGVQNFLDKKSNELQAFIRKVNAPI